MSNLLNQSARVAFSALIHGIGTFAERARLPVSETIPKNNQHFHCPHNQEKDRHSHVQITYMSIAINELEQYLPDLIKGDDSLFSLEQAQDMDLSSSLLNTITHRKPETFLQWVIATADRISSGFEREVFQKYNQVDENTQVTKRKNYYQSRLLTLFEQIHLEKTDSNLDELLNYAYDLSPICASNIFPQERNKVEPTDNETAQTSYLKLWKKFVQSLKQIPSSYRKNWDLWLDHFDNAYQCFTTCIPSATAFNVTSDISLYDHSKSTAALATALWRWHKYNNSDSLAQVENLKDDWDKEKFLLIQGDFFGIQDFIFSGGNDSNKQAAKLLRGRSFQVSLFTELAALKILNACELPSTSQIMNAAGKFLIVAPNTEKIRNSIIQVQAELNQWFINHTYGLIGIGLAQLPASCNDFIGSKFTNLIHQLFNQLEETKLKRFDLTNSTESIQNITYPNGVCRLNSHFPAETAYEANSKNSGLSSISIDQITIGEQLVKKNRMLICEQEAEIFKTGKTESLRLPIFGYNIIFTEGEEETGKFSELVNLQQLYRVWDFSVPKSLNEPVWNGYARRYINAYVPIENDQIKIFDEIAKVDEGIDALMTLKGDVDNLGSIFQIGLKSPTFAKMASLSRQMNQFFSLWLPAYCAECNPNIYTIFAGGDDFFLIGPWHSTQKVAFDMQKAFEKYVAQNPEIHFSVGMVMNKVGLPVPRLGDLAEQALEKAKTIDSGKNAITIFNQTLKLEKWQQLYNLENEIHHLVKKYNISASYLYSLIRLCEQANDEKNIESTMWRSRFYYRTARYVIDKLKQEQREKALSEITLSLGEKGIGEYKINFAIPLANYFYQKR